MNENNDESNPVSDPDAAAGPATEPVASSEVRPLRRGLFESKAMKAAAAGVAGLALAGGVVASMGASPSASSTAGTAGSTTASSGWVDGTGRHGMRGSSFGEITIASISGSSISLKTADGWTRTVTVTSSTAITKAGSTIAVGDLKAGDTIHFSETKNTDGSYSITAISVEVPTISGSVTAVSGSSITLKDRSGATWTVTTNSSTKVTLGSIGSKAGSTSDIKVGSDIVAAGTQGTGNTLTALSIHAALPSVFGTVTAISGNTITIQARGGTTSTVRVSSSTSYVAPNVTSPTLANVTVGSVIRAEGTQATDGSIDATGVTIGGAGGRGGMMPGHSSTGGTGTMMQNQSFRGMRGGPGGTGG